ncbi:MAG TPA: prolyl oligopeptidase family serine peptidase [Methylibium sp.]|nr:prolyl oligopeptidase family serine peptidase [Methylibium sp.]
MSLSSPTLLAAALALALALAYALVCARAAHRLTRACRSGAAAGADAGEPVELGTRDGRARLAARWLPADGAEGAVILLRARGGCCEGEPVGPALELAEALRGCRLSVLLIDPRDAGGAARRAYGGRECQQVLGAVDYLLARGVAAGRIGVLGASAGAVAALLAAVHEPAIGAVAADSAFADFPALLAAPRQPDSCLPAFVPPGALWCARWLCGVDLRALSPVRAAAALRGRPVLVIHGDDDPVVPVAHALAMAKASQARLWVTSSRRHAGSLRDAPGAYSAVVLRFFTHHLTARPAPLPCDRAPAPLPQAWQPAV